MTPEPVIDAEDDAEALACGLPALSPRAPVRPNVLAFAFPAARPRSVCTNSSGQRMCPRRSIGKRFTLFWGDERFVPLDHRDSNFRMAREALIDHVLIPAAHVHPIPTNSASPEEAAGLYEATLQGFYGSKTLDPERPLFDVTLLGLGEDGHTASLFPGTNALDERDAWVTSSIGVKPEPRISLTYPALESSRVVLLLIRP